MSRKQRVTRLVIGVYVVFVAAFVVSSTVQVARVVFAAEGVPGERVGEACAAELAGQIDRIERARGLAAAEPTGDQAQERYARERGQPAAGACEADPRGGAALAALARFDRAAAAHGLREAHELSPVRGAAQSFIRGPR